MNDREGLGTIGEVPRLRGAIELVRRHLIIRGIIEEAEQSKITCNESEIKESFEKPTPEEVIKLFADSIEREGLDLNKLTIDKMVINEKGDLLVLRAELRGEGAEYQLIDYTIKGHHNWEHKGRAGSEMTSFEITYWDQDDPYQPDTSKTFFGEYTEGKWTFKRA